MLPDEIEEAEEEVVEEEEVEQHCLNCSHFTGGASACPNCGAILHKNEDDDEELKDDGDLDEFDDEF